ncbi:eIF4E-3 [Reticulomyxa filosa]|uniref:eIF4E-3 n=1 Tax=Reticulomyxa filosa TaxID=46433 RepID=X6P307_RETFI|nr:eIF4E-3 [Reticulomyxa filosa]|eukprot:ETO32915.1 eIF4E-3 [Reticulomyxa filosa]
MAAMKNVSTTKQEESKAKQLPQLPLQYKWTLWHNAPSPNWKDKKVNIIGHFATVADFWRLFNNILPPSQLEAGSDYHLFKGNVKPEWEDQFNAHGGCWIFRFEKKLLISKLTKLGKSVYHTVLKIIGHNFDESDDICGLVVSMRDKNKGKLSLWIKEARNEKIVRSLGQQFKEFSRANSVEFQVCYISSFCIVSFFLVVFIHFNLFFW